VAALNLIQVKCPKPIRNDKRIEVTQRTLIKRVGMSALCQKRHSIAIQSRPRADVRFTAQSGHYAQLVDVIEPYRKLAGGQLGGLRTQRASAAE